MPDATNSEVYTQRVKGEPFPWQCGDPFWDGFTMTFELRRQPDGRVETIYHIEASTRAQVDRFIALITKESVWM